MKSFSATTRSSLQLVPSDSAPFSSSTIEQRVTERRIKKVIQLMRKELPQPITLTSLAVAAELSPRQLSRLFKIETNYATMHYLHLLRLEKACFLLANSWLRIKEICQQAGFADESNFDHKFKQCKGCSPCEFRKKVMARKNRDQLYE